MARIGCRAIGAFALLAVLAGCDDPVHPDHRPVIAGRNHSMYDRATGDRFMLRVELPRNLWVPCANGGAGEWVLGSGVLHLSLQQVTNENGEFLRFHVNHSRITGVGVDTGDEYVGQLVINEHLVAVGDAVSYSFVEHIHGITMGSSENFVVSIVIHLTRNANGDWTSLTESVQRECRG